MGGKGGALNMWIKEFTALVFTQTIQAFIYAIVISIILFGMVNVTGVSADDNNAALGLMSTFALLSVFKVEELSKKIFGVGDTKASHKNAWQSLAKTAFAAKLGSRVLNNTGKVLGGVRNITKAGQDRAKVKKRLAEDMADNGYEWDNDKKDYKYVGTKKTKSSPHAMSGTGEGSGAGVGGSSGGGNAQANAYDGLEDQMGLSDAAARRMRAALRNSEDKLSEIKKARDEGIKSIFSGVSESVGATFGATAGGILGGADGNLDELFQGMVAGAGVGDIIGKNAVEAVDRAIKFADRQINRKDSVSAKELNQMIKSTKDLIEKSERTYNPTSLDDI